MAKERAQEAGLQAKTRAVKKAAVVSTSTSTTKDDDDDDDVGSAASYGIPRPPQTHPAERPSTERTRGKGRGQGKAKAEQPPPASREERDPDSSDELSCDAERWERHGFAEPSTVGASSAAQSFEYAQTRERTTVGRVAPSPLPSVLEDELAAEEGEEGWGPQLVSGMAQLGLQEQAGAGSPSVARAESQGVGRATDETRADWETEGGWKLVVAWFRGRGQERVPFRNPLDASRKLVSKVSSWQSSVAVFDGEGLPCLILDSKANGRVFDSWGILDEEP
ncbi:hypothetical protein VTK73DRAFT_5310 [Phialemonium thermophilum]|uniref:Uncharacterized protein n=1 Tax=Phialemonium thermophilum TaxID=223376 RepID=A0ABR3V2W4_9PEZI